MVAANSTTESQNTSQFSKTKMCKFFRVGKCTKGTQCPFAHQQCDLRKQPDLRCTKFCQAFIDQGVCLDPRCTFAHSKEELRSRGALHKTRLCRNMQNGTCAFGRDCNFAHSAMELRCSGIDEKLKLPPGLGLGDDDETEEYCSGGSTDGRDSTVESEYKSERSTDFASSTYSTNLNDLGEPAYVSFDLSSEFQCNDLGQGMLGDYKFCASLGEPATLGFGFDWSFANDLVVSQKDQLNISMGASTKIKGHNLRSVRTSESTICTLSGSPRY
jgi:hypothetical protein